jgi:hypothetical protein
MCVCEFVVYIAALLMCAHVCVFACVHAFECNFTVTDISKLRYGKNACSIRFQFSAPCCPLMSLSSMTRRIYC